MRLLVPLVLLARAVFAQCAGSEPVAAGIPAVQGEGPRSPCTGRVVTVSGVVTAAFPGLSGYFLQDSAGDGRPETSDAIFVFTGSAANLPQAGAVVRATGKIAEFARAGRNGSVTELDTRASATPLAKTETLGAASLPAPVALDPPLAGDDYLEAREGMLVAYPAAAVVGPTNDFGEFYALRWDRLPPGVRVTAGNPAAGAPLLVDRAGGAVLRYVKTFDLLPPLTGILHFDFGAFRLEPAVPYTPDDGGWTPAPAPAGAPWLAAASMNCLQLLRSLKPDELARRLDKLALAVREELRSPDIVAVQEVEDADLLAMLGERAGGYQAVLLKGCDSSGINVGLLYKPARARLVATAQLEAEAPEFRKPACTLPDGRLFEQPMLDRPSLRVDFTVDAVPVTVVVNHWRSQIGGKDEQRAASGAFLARELARSGAENLIVLGDFNETGEAEGLRALASGAGLANLTAALPEETRYSYIFEGESEALDHVLVSRRLASRVAAAGYAHYNADFPETPWAADPSTPLRAADHDATWVHLNK